MSKKMSKKPNSPREGLRIFALWQLGLILFAAAAAANVLSPLVMGSLLPPGDTNAARGAAFGVGLVTVLCVVAGVVLIIMHFIRDRKSVV